MKKRIALLITAAAATATILAWRSATNGDATDGAERIDAATVENLRKFGRAVESGRVCATAAFAASDGAEHEALDGKALAQIEQIASVFAEIRSDLPAIAVDLASEIVERYESAQLQLMSLAINRKNRESDGGGSDMESADRAAFKRDSAMLSERLQTAISSRRM